MKFKHRAHVWAVLLFALVGSAQAERPKLVVGIVVDQLRFDYIERFGEHFPPGGFKLLSESGAFMTSAHYNYYPTVTGPGHAAFLSGATPSVHGIIANDWFDKRTGKYLNCVDDSSVEGVGLPLPSATEKPEKPSKAGKKSPRNFTGTTVADQLRLQYQSKVVGISIKDRGAILPSGKQPSGAYWFDVKSGRFITSTYYRTELPAWVEVFNARKLPESFIGQVWKRLLDPKLYLWSDAGAGEAPLPGERRPIFDHTIYRSPDSPFETIVPTPFGDQLVAEFARAAIEGEELGQGPQPDLLTVSFSSLDACGHRFGPYSHEIQDMMLRLDRQLAGLFSFLEKKIGLSNVVIVLTADHGVAPLPEFASAQGLPGKRVNEGKMVTALQAALVEKFGPGDYFLTDDVVEGNLYFDHTALRERELSPDALTAFIREWMFDTGIVQECYSRQQLLEGQATGQIGEKVLNGYNAERSGDMVIVYKPFAIPSSAKTGTTHGSPFSYDTHIPVFFYGTAFKPGRYTDAFNITDIAPTLSSALGVTAPSGCIGKPFTPVLVQRTALPKGGESDVAMSARPGAAEASR